MICLNGSDTRYPYAPVAAGTLFRLRTGETRLSLRRGFNTVVTVYKKDESRGFAMVRLSGDLQGFIAKAEFNESLRPDERGSTFEEVSVGDKVLARILQVQRHRSVTGKGLRRGVCVWWWYGCCLICRW